MNRKRSWILFVIVLTLLVSVGIANAQGPTGTGQPRANAGTAFTYQGQLKNGGSVVNGTCNFQFGLWDAAALGSQVGTTVTVSSVIVTNGLFTTPIDFGASAFNGDARYLGIAVACPSGSYTTFSSRQALTPAAMAFALPGLYTQQNGTSPNLIGGYSGNSVTSGVYGATIGGGGESGRINSVTANYGTIAGGYQNTASGESATIGGGFNNTASGGYATIGGGNSNTASDLVATVGGGTGNTASVFLATVGGGYYNTASGGYATVGGGDHNTASGNYATVPGGRSNSATMPYTLAAGRRAKANHAGTFVWADSTDTDFASTAQNQFLIRAGGGVGIGTNSPVTTLEVAGLADSYHTLAIRGTNTANRRTSLFFESTPGGVPTGEWELGTDMNQNSGHDLFLWDNAANAIRLSIDAAGEVAIPVLGSAGSIPLCRNASNQISTCSSSLRYKNDVANLNLGLDTLAQLRPVTFDWKDTGEPDLGFVAEEVNQVTPLLTTLNDQGQVEGVKYDRITAVLVKGMQEQQQQIADLKSQNASLEARVTALEQHAQTNNTGAHSDNTGNVAMIVIGALLGIVVVQKPWWRGEQ
jgi:hypothetical protein